VLTELETKLLGIMMMVIMLGMGASLTFKDFRIAFRKPQGILVGLLCQYAIMPFLAYRWRWRWACRRRWRSA
jgi:predicted Na+-dependent transporter